MLLETVTTRQKSCAPGGVEAVRADLKHVVNYNAAQAVAQRHIKQGVQARRIIARRRTRQARRAALRLQTVPLTDSAIYQSIKEKAAREAALLS